MTEAELQACVVDLAHVYGWKVAHFRPALTSKGWRTPVGADGKGFPDLVLAKAGADPIFIELKADTGKLSSEQLGWIAALWQHMQIWTPTQWANGTIHETLRSGLTRSGSRT